MCVCVCPFFGTPVYVCIYYMCHLCLCLCVCYNLSIHSNPFHSNFDFDSFHSNNWKKIKEKKNVCDKYKSHTSQLKLNSNHKIVVVVDVRNECI